MENWLTKTVQIENFLSTMTSKKWRVIDIPFLKKEIIKYKQYTPSFPPEDMEMYNYVLNDLLKQLEQLDQYISQNILLTPIGRRQTAPRGVRSSRYLTNRNIYK